MLFHHLRLVCLESKLLHREFYLKFLHQVIFNHEYLTNSLDFNFRLKVNQLSVNLIRDLRSKYFAYTLVASPQQPSKNNFSISNFNFYNTNFQLRVFTFVFSQNQQYLLLNLSNLFDLIGFCCI